MASIKTLAAELGVSERTLRRATNSGLIRAERLSARRLRLPASERRYIRARWPLLATLRSALRTEPNVRLAVLFGSVSRGDESAGSDVDVLVEVHDDDVLRLVGLADRLSAASGRRVDVLRVADADREPVLLSEVIRSGRVLVDRGDRWRAFRRRSAAAVRSADVDLDQRAKRALDALERYLAAAA